MALSNCKLNQITARRFLQVKQTQADCWARGSNFKTLRFRRVCWHDCISYRNHSDSAVTFRTLHLPLDLIQSFLLCIDSFQNELHYEPFFPDSVKVPFSIISSIEFVCNCMCDDIGLADANDADWINCMCIRHFSWHYDDYLI